MSMSDAIPDQNWWPKGGFHANSGSRTFLNLRHLNLPFWKYLFTILCTLTTVSRWISYRVFSLNRFKSQFCVILDDICCIYRSISEWECCSPDFFFIREMGKIWLRSYWGKGKKKKNYAYKKYLMVYKTTGWILMLIKKAKKLSLNGNALLFTKVPIRPTKTRGWCVSICLFSSFFFFIYLNVHIFCANIAALFSYLTN